MHHLRPVDRPDAAQVSVEIAVLRAAEGERRDAGRTERHVVGVEHALGAFDRQYEFCRAGSKPARFFQRRDHLVPADHFFARLDLGQEHTDDALDADHGVEVGLGHAGFEAVGADPDALACNLRRIGLHACARVVLLGHRHGIFEIEDEGVGGKAERLFEKLLAIGGNVEKAAGKRHGKSCQDVVTRAVRSLPCRRGRGRWSRTTYSAAVIFGCAIAASLVAPDATSCLIAASS
jgi:hypothetical protein